MSKEISFKKTTIDLIRRLTAINPAILIEKTESKDGEKISIKSSDASGSVASVAGCTYLTYLCKYCIIITVNVK